MNYNILRYFSVLAEVEHYTLAAARLGISQPSLSSAIHNLEMELGGIKLFEKVGRNIRLTEEGRFYREKVDAALNELHDAAMTLKESKLSAPIVIRMGCVSGSLTGTAAREIAAYVRGNKRIRFRITESSAENLMDMVRQEKLDMALVDLTDRDRSLHFRKLGEQSFYVALPIDHPLAAQTELLPQQILREPQIVFNYDMGSSFQEWASGSTPEENVVCTVDTAEAALDLVEAGVGISIIPQTCVREREDVVCLPLKNWRQALYMCILYDKWLEPPVWDFVELLVKSIRKNQPN
ncbi:MAG: LysR family transcriptional regulator [Oscillospiraceae bacterium]|nr:LysR family transcriptional regulator [Oscillospiraceae bacterium]